MSATMTNKTLADNLRALFIANNGGPCGDRTHDTRIKSPVLYQAELTALEVNLSAESVSIDSVIPQNVDLVCSQTPLFILT